MIKNSIIKSPAQLPATPKIKGGPGVYDGLPVPGAPRRSSNSGVPEKIIDNVGATTPGGVTIKSPAKK